MIERFISDVRGGRRVCGGRDSGAELYCTVRLKVYFISWNYSFEQKVKAEQYSTAQHQNPFSHTPLAPHIRNKISITKSHRWSLVNPYRHRRHSAYTIPRLHPFFIQPSVNNILHSTLFTSTPPLPGLWHSLASTLSPTPAFPNQTTIFPHSITSLS